MAYVQSTAADSLFNTCHRQADGVMDGGHSCVFGSSIRSISSDYDTKPFGLCNNDTPRQLVDSGDLDGEADLQGFVSKILEEAEPEEIRHTEGILSIGNSIWSPSKSNEDQLKGFQSEAKPQNHIFHNPFGEPELQPRSKDVETLRHFSSPPKLPPGLPLPNPRNVYQHQLQQSQYLNGGGYTNEMFTAQSDLSSLCSDLLYEVHSNENRRQPSYYQNSLPNDFDHLFSNLHTLMPSGHYTRHPEELPNMQTIGLQNEENSAEPWKIPNSTILGQSFAMQSPKQHVGEFGRGWKKQQNGEVMKQAYKPNAFLGAPDFRSRNTVNFQQPKPCSPVEVFNHYQNSVTMNREKTNAYMKQYLKSHIQRCQTKNNKSPLQKQKRRTPTSAFSGEDVSRRRHNSSQIRAGDEQPIPYVSYPTMQSEKFNGKPSAIHYNSNLGSRSPRPTGSSNVGNVSAIETDPVNSRASELSARGGEGLCPRFNTAMQNLMQKAQDGAVIQFPNYLMESFEQWRCLEMERKKIEQSIMETACENKPTVPTVPNGPNYPQIPPTVDQLIVNQKKEQAKVSALLIRLDHQYNMSAHIGIHEALSRHQMAICRLQLRFQDELSNMGRQELLSHLSLNKDAMLTNVALEELAAATRKLRAVLYCAHQMILPKPVKTPDNHVENKGECAEKCEGNSFKIFKISMK